MNDERQLPKRDPSLPGYAVMGAMITGGASLVLVFWAVQDNEHIGAGIMLLAAAIAFGSAANAMFRS